MKQFGLWRVFFFLGALFIMIGGPQHPGGTMAEMLAHPGWVSAHVWVLAGFVTFLVGLILYGKQVSLPERTKKWLRFAIVGTILQCIEMVVHTVAYVDLENLNAGNATPILSTHLFLAAIFYPIFGITVIGLIVAGVLDRSLGSRWIAWLGILGAAAHGLAPPMTMLRVPNARILFPFLMLLALWMVLAAFWPSRSNKEG